MSRNLIALCILIIILFTFTSCLRSYNLDSDIIVISCENPDEMKPYVWICEDPKICLIANNNYPVIGEYVDGEETRFIEAYDNQYMICFKYLDKGALKYIYNNQKLEEDFEDDTKLFVGRYPDFQKEYFVTKGEKDSPKYKYKKLTFNRYLKSEVIPSDYGFDLGDWDEIPDRIIIKGIGGEDFPLSEWDAYNYKKIKDEPEKDYPFNNLKIRKQ